MYSTSTKLLLCGTIELLSKTSIKTSPVKQYSCKCRKTTRESNNDICCPNMLKGIDYLMDPRINKGLAFTMEERQAFGIQGLLPGVFRTQEEQIKLNLIALDRCKTSLDKYVFLCELQARNERLFYSLVTNHVEKTSPVIGSPAVGISCQKFGLIYRRIRGLFVTIHDKGRIYEILQNWPETDIRAIVFTDGERVLGLGDLGAHGMNIPVGKLTLYTALAGIKPQHCLPITLDVGTNNKALLEDPLYIGVRQKRVKGKDYVAFVDEFMDACVRRFGRYTLLQFEDFGFVNAKFLLARYRDHYNTFNGDIQGTAGAAMAGIYAAQRILKNKISDGVYVFLGAGSVATGTSELLILAMVEEGLTEQEALNKIYMFDIDGYLSLNRKGGVPKWSKKFAKDDEPENDFSNLVVRTKATCLIGCSTVGGAFTPAILKQMNINTPRPIILALSNPTKQAECTPLQAYENTEGRCIYAAGAPFKPFTYNGKQITTGQGNNAYIFPGIALGAMVAAVRYIPESLFLTAAKTLAKTVTEEFLANGRIYPPLTEVQQISVEIAASVFKYAFEAGLSSVFPEPKDYKQYIRDQLYQLEYPNYLLSTYKYPEMPKIPLKKMEEAFTLKI